MEEMQELLVTGLEFPDLRIIKIKLSIPFMVLTVYWLDWTSII